MHFIFIKSSSIKNFLLEQKQFLGKLCTFFKDERSFPFFNIKRYPRENVYDRENSNLIVWFINTVCQGHHAILQIKTIMALFPYFYVFKCCNNTKIFRNTSIFIYSSICLFIYNLHLDGTITIILFFKLSILH